MIEMLAIGCKVLKIDATTLKELTLAELSWCFSVVDDDDVYDDLSDCIGVKVL